MPSTLDQIVSESRARVAAEKRSADIRHLEREAENHRPRGFRAALETASKKKAAIIAELKKASPSRGLIRPDFNVVALATELEQAGAAAFSVLTERKHFQGSLENLSAASSAAKLPCLRKDFIVDELQILEARAHRADAILLIVAALQGTELVALHQAAKILGLDTVCEVHDQDELQRGLDAGCEIIAVNSRDLHNFDVTLDTATKLAEKLPTNVFRIAESGIHSLSDLQQLAAAGYQAFLVGEMLMRAPHPGAALKSLLGEGDTSLSANRVAFSGTRR